MIFTRVVIGALIVLAVGISMFGWRTCAFVSHGLRYAERARTQLLCDTDHHALLCACRQLSERVAIGNLCLGKYRVRLDPAPEASQFPETIQDLGPSYVRIDDDGRVMIEMLGGLGHLGVLAYPGDYEKPFSDFRYGDRELVPDLWYYDDGYRADPDFDKVIDTILAEQKHGDRQEDGRNAQCTHGED